MLEGIKTSERVAGASDDGWRSKILWVDDRPDNNIYERQAFESMGITFTLALSTNEALTKLNEQRFAAIISDMGRKEGPREGYVLLEKVRETDGKYRSSFTPVQMPLRISGRLCDRGAQGTTNRARELVDMVIQALPEKDAV